MVCKPLVKPKHRKGLWSPDEDQRLRNYVVKHGHACWSSVPINAGLQRNGKSCRLRWINYLRPGLKRGTFSMQEEETILTLHRLLGNKWSQISNHLPGRTDNEIKNYFHTYLKKKLLNSKGSQETTKSNCKINPTITPKKREIPSDDTSETTRMSTVDQKPTKSQSLPKLMFTDWLALEGFACSGDVVVSGKGPTLEQHFNFNPSFQDYNFTDGNYDFIYHEASLVGEFQNSLSDGGSAGDDLFGSDFRFEGQSSGSDQFADFSSGNHICTDFSMNNVMYI